MSQRPINLAVLNYRKEVERVRQPVGMQRVNCSAAPTNMKLIHWPLTGGLLHLVQRGRDWAGSQSAQAPPRCTKRNSPPINPSITAHSPSINHRIAV